jgi:hypothetical protein
VAASLRPSFLKHLRERTAQRRVDLGPLPDDYLLRYAQESSWREDNRRVANGEQTQRVAHLAMKRGPSVDFSGYWQRHIKAA